MCHTLFGYCEKSNQSKYKEKAYFARFRSVLAWIQNKRREDSAAEAFEGCQWAADCSGGRPATAERSSSRQLKGNQLIRHLLNCNLSVADPSLSLHLMLHAEVHCAQKQRYHCDRCAIRTPSRRFESLSAMPLPNVEMM